MRARFHWLALGLSLAATAAFGAAEPGGDSGSDGSATADGSSTHVVVGTEPAPGRPARADRVRAAIDGAFYLGVASVWYVLDETNEVDRIYDVSLNTLGKKLITREAFRFDDNGFGYASPGHATSGTLYYLSGRSHGWGTIESFLLSATFSAMWELGVEFKEVLSINDVLMTPTAGFAFGESAFQIGEYFRRSHPTPVNWVLATVLSGPSPLLPWHGPRRDFRTHPLDARGHPLDMWGRVRVTAGADLTRGEGGGAASAGVVGFDARVLDLDDYGRAGTSGPTWIERSVGGELRARMALSPEGIQESWLSTDAIFAAARGRDVSAVPTGLSGVEWIAGPSALYEHRQFSDARGADKLGAVGPLGGAAHLAFYSGALQIRADARLHPVFAATDSAAWRTAFGTEAGPLDAPNMLRGHGFYFGVGARFSTSVDVAWHGWRAGAWAQTWGLSSAEWLEVPSQASSVALEDERIFAGGSLGHALPLRGVSMQAAVEHYARWSRAAGAREESSESRLLLQLVYDL